MYMCITIIIIRNITITESTIIIILCVTNVIVIFLVVIVVFLVVVIQVDYLLVRFHILFKRLLVKEVKEL